MGEVTLAIVEDEGAAEIVCGALRAEGITCLHRYPPGVAGEGGYSFAGAREILVDEADLDRARELLEPVEPIVDACARCGRAIGDGGGWYASDTGELEPYCGVCAERVFGLPWPSTAAPRTRRPARARRGSPATPRPFAAASPGRGASTTTPGRAR